jgi:citrate lyase synthetase
MMGQRGGRVVSVIRSVDELALKRVTIAVDGKQRLTAIALFMSGLVGYRVSCCWISADPFFMNHRYLVSRTLHWKA